MKSKTKEIKIQKDGIFIVEELSKKINILNELFYYYCAFFNSLLKKIKTMKKI